MKTRRHADVFKWQGQWWVEIRTYHVGWTDVHSAWFNSHAEALGSAVRMVGA